MGTMFGCAQASRSGPHGGWAARAARANKTGGDVSRALALGLLLGACGRNTAPTRKIRLPDTRPSLVHHDTACKHARLRLRSLLSRLLASCSAHKPTPIALCRLPAAH
jgi:hypothetical protein